MKVVSVGYQLYRETATSTRDWYFLYIRWTDNTEFGFTNGDRSKEIGGITYVPGLRPFAVQETNDLDPTNTQTEGGMSSDAISDADIRAGRWDRAYIEYFRAKWDDLGLGIEKISSGYIGDITRGRTKFVADVFGLSVLLNQQIGRVVEPACDAELGDTRCKVRLDPPAWAALTAYTVRPSAEAGLGSVVKHASAPTRHFKCTTAGTSGAAAPAWNAAIGGTTNDGSVVWTTIQALTVTGSLSSVTDARMEFRDNTRTEAADFFGEVEFTSGDNDGLARELKSYAANGTMIPQLPFPYDVQVGDTYILRARCRFRFTEDCKAVFDNGNNFRGFPHVPGVDFLSSGKVGEQS